MSIELAPAFILRGTGLPFELMESLSTPESVRSAERALRLEARLRELERQLLEELARTPKDRLSRGERRRAKQAIKHRRSEKLLAETVPELHPRLLLERSRLLSEFCAAEAEVQLMVEAEHRSISERLFDLVRDPKIEEAIWLSSPQAFDGLQRMRPRVPRNKKEHQLHRLALSYLQRFCAKNDTAAFFGPYNFGEVFQGENGDELLSWQREPYRVGERYVFISRHVVDALAQAMSRDPDLEQGLPLALHPSVERNAESLFVSGKKLPLLPGQVNTILRLQHEPRQKLESALGAPFVARLVSSRLLVPEIAPSATSLDEIEDLSAAVSELSESESPWALRLRELRNEALRTAQAQWPERRSGYEAAEGLLESWNIDDRVPDRPRGQLYTDRSVFFEESKGGLEDLALHGQRLLECMPGLHAILRAHAAYAEGVRRDARAWVYSLWQESGLSDAVPLGKFLQETGSSVQGFHPFGWSERAEGLWENVGALLPEDQSRIALSSRQVEAALGDLSPKEPFLCSPDVMLSATDEDAVRAGRATPILAEVHHGVQVWSFFARLAEGRTRASIMETLKRWCAHISQGTALATLLDPRMTGKTFNLEYPGLTIERFARSAKPRDQVRSLWDVYVQRNGSSLMLTTERDNELLLAPHSPVDPMVRAFGALVLWGPRLPKFSAHLPRVSVDGVVWFRETWRVKTEEWREHWEGRTVGDAVVAATRLREVLGLPRRVFISCSTEPKPYYCDMESSAFAQLLRTLALRNDELLISEMLPGPEGLWLRWPGERYTAELRLSMLVGEAR